MEIFYADNKEKKKRFICGIRWLIWYYIRLFTLNPLRGLNTNHTDNNEGENHRMIFVYMKIPEVDSIKTRH